MESIFKPIVKAYGFFRLVVTFGSREYLAAVLVSSRFRQHSAGVTLVGEIPFSCMPCFYWFNLKRSRLIGPLDHSCMSYIVLDTKVVHS